MSVLILAPHADDEVLGVGGTIARSVAENKEVTIAVLTGHGREKHPLWEKSLWETVRGECQKACDVMGVTRLIYRELPAACLDITPIYEINDTVQKVIAEVAPDELYVPFANDLHKDHGAVAYAASVATRPYLPLGKSVRRVLAYETLSETHLAPPYIEPAFQPNCFVDISDHLETKLRAMEQYESQIQTGFLPRSRRGLTALAEYRGGHIGVAAAEAFVLLREVS